MTTDSDRVAASGSCTKSLARGGALLPPPTSSRSTLLRSHSTSLRTPLTALSLLTMSAPAETHIVRLARAHPVPSAASGFEIWVHLPRSDGFAADPRSAGPPEQKRGHIITFSLLTLFSLIEWIIAAALVARVSRRRRPPPPWDADLPPSAFERHRLRAIPLFVLLVFPPLR